MPKILAVFFDCDGTLVDSEQIGADVLLDMAARHGYFGPKNGLVARFKSLTYAQCVEWLQKNSTEVFPPQFLSDARMRMEELFRTELKPIPDIKATLDRISVSICVTSSAPRSKVDLALKTTGLLDRFGGMIFSAEELEIPKPELFVYAAKRFGLSHGSCAIVDDCREVVQTAREIGFHAIHFDAEATEAKDAWTMHSMTELPDLIQSLEIGSE